MSQGGLHVFDVTVQKSQLWIKEVMAELGWTDRERAYLAWKAALHALRDRLSVIEAAQLGAQLPLLLRGAYYEDWKPAHKPRKERHKAEFLAHIRQAFLQTEAVDEETVACAVFRVLARHITEGESIRWLLPADLRVLWPPRSEEIVSQAP